MADTTPGVEIKVTDGNFVTKALPYVFMTYLILSILKVTGVLDNKKG
jgi:spore maturation protein SpmB